MYICTQCGKKISNVVAHYKEAHISVYIQSKEGKIILRNLSRFAIDKKDEEAKAKEVEEHFNNSIIKTTLPSKLDRAAEKRLVFMKSVLSGVTYDEIQIYRGKTIETCAVCLRKTFHGKRILSVTKHFICNECFNALKGNLQKQHRKYKRILYVPMRD